LRDAGRGEGTGLTVSGREVAVFCLLVDKSALDQAVVIYRAA
jgi:hypothetical protein